MRTRRGFPWVGLSILLLLLLAAPLSASSAVASRVREGALAGPQWTERAAPSAASLAVSVEPSSAIAPLGSAASYTVHLTNTGALTDTFALSVDDSQPDEFISSLSGYFRTLGPGRATHDLRFAVTPLTSTLKLANTTTLVVISISDRAISATVAVTTTATPPAIGQGRITGAVANQSGLPIAGADVYLYRYGAEDASPARLVQTRADGTFTSPDLPAGSYYLQADASWLDYARGYYGGTEERSSASPVFVSAEVAPVGVLWRLSPGGSLSGRVLTADGARPVPAALVEVLPADGRQYVASTLSAADGTYHLRGIAPGSYYLRASPPTFGSVSTYLPRYYPDAPSTTEAAAVPILPAVHVPNLDLRLLERTAPKPSGVGGKPAG